MSERVCEAQKTSGRRCDAHVGSDGDFRTEHDAQRYEEHVGDDVVEAESNKQEDGTPECKDLREQGSV